MTGPGRISKAFVRWLKIDTPVTSDGSRSGVNWIRRNEHPSDRESGLARTVLPVPGTSSTRMWPRQIRATSASSISWCLPKMTRSTFSTTPETRSARALSTVLTYPSSLSFRAPFPKYGFSTQHNAGGHQVHIRFRDFRSSQWPLPRVARRAGALAKRGCPRGPARGDHTEPEGREGALSESPASRDRSRGRRHSDYF